MHHLGGTRLAVCRGTELITLPLTVAANARLGTAMIALRVRCQPGSDWFCLVLPPGK